MSDAVYRRWLMERCGDCAFLVFFFQAEDGIRDLVRSRGLGDVYKRQARGSSSFRRSSLRAASMRSLKDCAICLGVSTLSLSLIHI